MDLTAILFAFLSAVLMGTIGVFAKITGLSAEVITFFRLMLGAMFMMLFLIGTGNVRLLRQWPSWQVIISGFFLAGFILFYVHSMNYIPMAVAIMLIYLAPLAASVVAHFFMGEKLNLTGFALIIAALFGSVMMMELSPDLSVIGLGSSLGSSKKFIGICFGLLAMIAYAGFIIVNRLIREEIHVHTRTFYSLLTGACVTIPFAVMTIQEVTVSHIPWLVGAGLAPGFLGILFAVIALSRLPAAMFSTIAYSEPVAVAIFGWTIFNESLSLTQMSGCAIIILSGIIKTLKERE